MTGNNVVLKVNATGTNLKYQWQKDFVNISGATTDKYSTVLSATENGTTFRCIVSNSKGSVTSRSAVMTVGSVRDADGNIYTSIRIGSQEWTVENLRTTSFNGGTGIPNVTDSALWLNQTTVAYCFYNNSTNADEQKKWGALYNWYAVSDGRLVPTGWRVPTEAAWLELQNYMIANEYNYDGTSSENKIASSLASQSDWTSANTIGSPGNNLEKNNSSSFNGLPGGGRNGLNSQFFNRIQYGFWWSSTSFSEDNAVYMDIAAHYVNLISGNSNKRTGMSVRLIRE